MLRPYRRITMIKSMTPNLMVENVNKAVEFYRDVLGFEFITSVPESGQFDWAMMKHGTVEIMFQTIPSLTKELTEFSGKPVGGTLTFYTRVENVKQLFDRIGRKTVVVHGL